MGQLLPDPSALPPCCVDISQTRQIPSFSQLVCGTAYIFILHAGTREIPDTQGVLPQVDVYDVAGIGRSASGAAAGLLHPLSPSGKVSKQLRPKQ